MDIKQYNVIFVFREWRWRVSNKPVTRVGDRIIRVAQHTEPYRHIVAWCPHCLTYGAPMGETDRVCGNCGKDECRIYEEVLENKEPECQE